MEQDTKGQSDGIWLRLVSAAFFPQSSCNPRNKKDLVVGLIQRTRRTGRTGTEVLSELINVCLAQKKVVVAVSR